MNKNPRIILSALMMAITFNLAGQVTGAASAADMTKLIISQTGSEPVTNTVDIIKAGDPQTQVTGIVTCMFASMNVLRKAVELKCNLIITHEPLFYNHRDETSQFSGDPVFLEKKKYIDDNKLVVWRFHDYIHRMKPDGIDYGMIRKMGWLKYQENNSSNRITLPETTLDGVVRHLKGIFPGYTFDVIGNPSMKVKNVAFSAGAPGSAAHYLLLRDSNTDLVVAGEVPQWETYEYVRDAVEQGRNKAIIFLGHIPSEDAGMQYAAEWMKGFIRNIPVNYVECGPSYRSY